MGLTLIALLTGQSPLCGMSDKEVRRAWQKGIHCPDTVSPQLASLLQNLIRYDPQQRPDHARVRRWLEKEGAVEASRVSVKPSGSGAARQKAVRPLRFKDRVILDVHELVEAASQDWDYAAFLLRQHQLNDFLLQFTPKYYQLCETYSHTFDEDEGLFRLLQSIEPSVSFCWCGKTYRDLEDFAQQSAAESPLRSDSAPVRFLRLGLLEFYLEKNSGSAEQCNFAVELRRQAQSDPDLAITQLLISMSAHPEFRWYGHTFYTIDDVAAWILECGDHLDQAVEELYKAKQFEAWLDFIQCGRFLPEVKNKVQEVSL